MIASFYIDDRPCVIGGDREEHHFPDETSPCACGQCWVGVHPTLVVPRSPRVLARITEDDTTAYHLRCERGWCAQLPAENAYDSLAMAAHDARSHAVAFGHAVLVEVL